jgi:hypothetical protein
MSKPRIPGNRPWALAMVEARRSSATSRHKSVRDYRRKPKHSKKGWDA